MAVQANECWRMETGIDPDPVMAILQEALRRQAEERGAFVRSACGGDEELYRELDDALQWEERMGNFLLEPLMDFTLLVCPFEPGQTIGDGRFEILREIGEGGMGVVYEAFDRKLQQQIAIKAAKPGFQRLLSPELKAALKVRHQNICLVNQIHTAQTEYGEVDFLAMELLEGETLSANLARAGKLSHEEALEIACQVCAGLAEAHRSGIIHRDLKSGNVILCNNEDGSRRAVITDFGLAGGTAITSVELAGTPAYMAPELWRGEPPSKASDVYALGIMLYEMVAGRRPYQAESSSDESGTTGPLLSSLTQEQWQHRAYTETPPPPSTFVKHLDPRWDRVIMRCLQPLPSQRPEAGEVLTQLQRKRLPKALFVVPALLILVLTAIVGLVRPVRQWAIGSLSRPHIPDLKERQLTANPLEDWITSAAISPDGKYVAYQDQTGLYMRSIDSGETHPITLPSELRRRISSLCWFPEGGKLLASVDSSTGSQDIWVITVLGAAPPRLLYQHGVQPTISPDGRMLAFAGSKFGEGSREIWVGGINGETPRKLVDGGGSTNNLVAESTLPKSDTLMGTGSYWFVESWSPDWRLLFSVVESSELPAKDGLWEVHVEPSTGEAIGKPARLTQWSESTFWNPTITSDGKRLWPDVYLAELASGGASMKAPRRFTLDDRGSHVSGWTRDGQAILFDSERNGRREIFRQGLNENVAEAFISGPGDVYAAKFSPDGSWVLYLESESGAGSSDSIRLMRWGIGDGSPQMMLEFHDERGIDTFWCSSNSKASFPCVLALVEGKDLVFHSLDPIRGKGTLLGKIGVFGTYMGWGLSPDGSQLALVDRDKYGGRIEILRLADGTWHEIALEHGTGHLQSIAWAADGKSLFVTSWMPDSYDLLHVSLAGKSQRLLSKSLSQWLVSPIPSPDGRHLAFSAQTEESNVWLIDNF
jgi:serine/threonine protein kinase